MMAQRVSMFVVLIAFMVMIPVVAMADEVGDDGTSFESVTDFEYDFILDSSGGDVDMAVDGPGVIESAEEVAEVGEFVDGVWTVINGPPDASFAGEVFSDDIRLRLDDADDYDEVNGARATGEAWPPSGSGVVARDQMIQMDCETCFENETMLLRLPDACAGSLSETPSRIVEPDDWE